MDLTQRNAIAFIASIRVAPTVYEFAYSRNASAGSTPQAFAHAMNSATSTRRLARAILRAADILLWYVRIARVWVLSLCGAISCYYYCHITHQYRALCTLVMVGTAYGSWVSVPNAGNA